MSRTWPQDIGAIALLDGSPLSDSAGRLELEAVRAAIQDRLHLVPRLRQVIHAPRRGLGPPFWADAAAFDLSEHVRQLTLESPAGEAELLAAVEQLRRQPLDASRPLWEMWFVTGLQDQRIGLYFRIHHTVADGMAAMSTVLTFLDPTPQVQTTAAPPWEPAPYPSNRALLADVVGRRVRGLAGAVSALARPRSNLRRFRAAWPAIRELLAEVPATRTSLDRMVGRSRRVALFATDLDLVRLVGAAHHATVNDVLLALMAGGLRALLGSRAEALEGTTVRIYVPVSLRRRVRGPQHGNLIAQMAVPLELGEPEPSRRLRHIAAETTRRKALARASLGSMMVGGRLGRRLILAAVMRQRVNATSASIPGPQLPLYLAGARLLEVYPVLPLVANEPLGVGALSYAGTLYIGITADDDAFRDLDILVGGMREELRLLTAASGARVAAAGEPERALPETGGAVGVTSAPRRSAIRAMSTDEVSGAIRGRTPVALRRPGRAAGPCR